jgi:Domain of unknown function (DUF5671)
MASSEELFTFVKDALSRDVPRDKIREILVGAGWSMDQIKPAMDAYADVEFPIPVPRPKPYVSARETFFYLIMFTTLTIAAFNLGSLIFQLINKAFPDAADTMRIEWVDYQIRWAISYIVIAFPLFLFVSRRINRAVTLDPVKRASKVRKWLTYIMLFIAAGFVIGDLTTLVYNLLGGELSLRFILKVLTVGVIAGTIFTYYLVDLRKDETETETL